MSLGLNLLAGDSFTKLVGPARCCLATEIRANRVLATCVIAFDVGSGDEVV